MFSFKLPGVWTRVLSTAACLVFVVCACIHTNFLAHDPVAVYLTWQRQPDTTMTVQWIGPSKDEASLLEYRPETDTAWLLAEGTHHPLPQGHTEYSVHVVELTKLTPDTVYHFRFPGKPKEYKFQTMPSHLDGSIRFVVGGDMFHEGTDLLKAANQRAAKTNPRFGVAGGDLAYASARLEPGEEDYERWLEFLVRWFEDMVTPDGVLIPMVPLLGNHDVNGRYGQPPSSAPFFYALFSMPGLQGYNVLDFGDYMTLVLLDTDHTHPIAGDQTDWLRWVLSNRQNFLHRFAAYHVPAYPSVRNFDGKHNPSIRANWVPLFEEFDLNVAFEHHEHAYKRSHPIKAGKVDSSGVVYLGDGAWGATPRTPRTPEERWYLAKTAAAQHFLVVDVTSTTRYFRAIDVTNGHVIDELSQPVAIPATLE